MMDKSTVQKDFLNALIAGDRVKSKEISADLLNQKIGIIDLYEKFLRGALYEIGDLWEKGKISIATEHMASAIVEALMNQLFLEIISNKKINKTAIATCTENEFHQIGIKMVADVFEMHNWNVHFLGANTPLNDLITFTKSINPDIIAVSVSIYFNLPQLDSLLKSLAKEMPGLHILAGGQAFRHGGREILQKYNNVIYLADLVNLESLIRDINQDADKLVLKRRLQALENDQE